MSKVIKLDQDYLKRIEELQKQFLDVTMTLGQLYIDEQNLNNIKENLFKTYSELKDKEKSLINDIGKKYGYGNLNVQTGELVISE